jgi:type 1 glutamine amidotransferase
MNPSRFRQIFGIFAALLCFAFASHAAPIRVGIFKSLGPNRYYHTSIHTGSSEIVAILAKPDSANLGPNLIVPRDGFVTTLFGIDTSCKSNGCTASAGQKAAFMAALDTLDAVVFPHITDFGGSMPDTSQRSRLLRFFHAKGVVSIHGSIDTYGSWPSWDSIHGTRFNNWTTSNPEATLHLDTAAKGDPHWRFLNRGLPDTSRFAEEWMSFTTNGNVIRAQSGLKVSVNVDESSYNMGGARAMGDHPMSWFREHPGGGRFFFTALGHRAQLYTASAPTNFVRRQLYNAILWAAGVDSNGVVGVRPAGATGKGMRPEVRVSRSEVSVRVAEETPYRVDIHTLDGRRVASLRGQNGSPVTFRNLKPHAVYLVSIVTPRQRESRRILLD